MSETSETEELKQKLALLELKQQKLELKEGLPHLYGFPWYPWAKTFFESRNPTNFLVAANQISKSSTQIRKVIHWATETSLWPALWPRRKPSMFWYFYPTKDVAAIEFDEKWEREFLPAGKYKTDPKYGWTLEKKEGAPWALHFNSGVSVYFKTYAQKAKDLQSATVDAVFADEEMPEDLWDEVNLRRQATDGYFHMVFTATLGQEIWRRTMEERGNVNEKFADAFKLQVSMFDCLEYEDGTPGAWTPSRIQRVINSCKTDAEVQRRVYGKFVVDSGLKYPTFSRKRNMKTPETLKVGHDWAVYAGVDPGGGGEGHPGAIAFVCVRPDFKYGRVFRGWRGEGELTTAGDVLNNYRSLKRGLTMTGAYYDWQSKDFSTISVRESEPFFPAEKSHEIGEQVLGVLFKNGMLDIDDVPELEPLALELTTLKKATPKMKAKDDFCDALRYAVTRIPWDWSAIPDFVLLAEELKEKRVDVAVPTVDDLRREFVLGKRSEEMEGPEGEFAEWGELYDV